MPQRKHARVQRPGVAGPHQLADAPDDGAAAVDDLDTAVVERDGEEGRERGQVPLAPLLEAVWVFFLLRFERERERGRERRVKEQ